MITIRVKKECGQVVMMKVLLAEYTMIHEPALAQEGRAMLDVLTGSFERCGHEIIVPSGKDFKEDLTRLAATCDAALVIAPDHLLAGFTQVIEQSTHNLGCGSMNAALCANKLKTGRILASHGIPVPEEQLNGLKVVKPVTGCGAMGVRLTTHPPAEGEFGQRFINGDHLSVSLVSGRVVGEACLNFSGKAPLALAVNRQDIHIENGRFEYCGGETPVDHPRHTEIVDVATRTVGVLGCQGYAGVDVVVADRVYVVDVNPRITTSLIGITAVMKEEIAKLIVDASHGQLPDRVHLTGHVRFKKHGVVIPS